MSFGIAALGLAAAPERVTLEAIARATGSQAAMLRSRLGFEAAHRAPAGRDISPWHLLVEASRAALRDAHLGASDPDLVLTVGRTRLDYLCFAYGLAILKELGGKGPVALDLGDYTGGPLLTGLRVAAAKFHADERRNTILLAVHHRFSDLVDAQRPADLWHWPTSDGAAALVLRRDGAGPQLLGHAFASEGRGSGLMALRRETIDEGPDPTSWFEHEWAQAKYLTFRDAEAWYADYRERCVRRLPQVVEQAVRRAGLGMDEVARVQAGFLFPDIASGVRDALGVGARFAHHNAHGMMGGVEGAFALEQMRRDPALRGRAVVLCHAGTPADFGAAVLRMA